jgi:cytosine deaminase
MNKPLLIKNAKLRNGNIVDIFIKDKKIEEIAPNIEVTGADIINAENNLVTPPFCDSHLHLDATLSIGKPRYNMSGTLLEGIQIWGERKDVLTKDVIKKNAIDVIHWEVANGSMFLRSHADVTDITGIAVEALLEVRDEVKEIADLQIVAFPQDCIYTFDEGEKLLEDAMKKGCNVVGGLPYLELSPEDGLKDIKYVFDLAEKYDAMVDVHCDENTDDQSRYVEAMARETIVRKMNKRVTASHTTAMHNYNNDFAGKLIGNIKRAEMNIITNPFANSCLQNRTDGYPRHRGHTRVDELLASDVNIAIGSDDIMDPWYPMGKGSPLAGANLLMNYAQLSGYKQVPQLFDMITYNSAKTMMIEDYGIEKGKTANLVILDTDNEFDAIRLLSEAKYVIRNGNIISKTEPAKRTVFENGKEIKIDFKVGPENL